MFNLDGMIPKVCLLAQETREDGTDKRLRSAGLQVLSSMVIHPHFTLFITSCTDTCFSQDIQFSIMQSDIHNFHIVTYTRKLYQNCYMSVRRVTSDSQRVALDLLGNYNLVRVTNSLICTLTSVFCVQVWFMGEFSHISSEFDSVSLFGTICLILI